MDVPDIKSLIPQTTTDDITASMSVGDLAKLTPEQRVSYYLAVCQSAGLNPLTRPFTLMKNKAGEVILYANKQCAEQLRKRDRVSLRVVSREEANGIYIVTIRASTLDREEEAIGALALDGLKGQALADAYMKCETKAKNRATMAICGLGFAMDEDAYASPVPFDTRTGEITESHRPRPLLTREAGKSVEEHASDLWGADAPRAPAAKARNALMHKIDAIMVEQGLSPAQQGAAWEKWHAKYPDLSPAALTMIYEGLTERLHTLYAQEVDAAMVAEDTLDREPGCDDQ
jgi:hypothetical protein